MPQQTGTQAKLNVIELKIVESLLKNCRYQCGISTDYLINSHFETCDDSTEQYIVFKANIIGHEEWNSSQLAKIAKITGKECLFDY